MELEQKKRAAVTIELKSKTVVKSCLPVEPTLEIRQSLQQEPNASPIMFQTWRDILFLHWEWDPAAIQAALPDGLYVDTHNGKAYVSVTPFFMNDVRASMLPPLPGATDFLELNVRTYVYNRAGVPGIWFYSLDCNHSLAVLLARIFYSLPYYSADMNATIQAGLVEYSCQRRGANESSQFFYRKKPDPIGSQPGTLAFFLAERYKLYSFSPRTRTIHSARVHHQPWQIFEAELGKYDDTMLRLNKLDSGLRPPNHAWVGSPVRVKIYTLGED